MSNPKFSEVTLMLHAAYLSEFKAPCTELSFCDKAELRTTYQKTYFAFRITLSGSEVRGAKTAEGNHPCIMGKAKNPLQILRQQVSRARRDSLCKGQICMDSWQKQQYFHLILCVA